MSDGFTSVYAGMTGAQISALPAARRRRMWESDRQAIADLWFSGDVERADKALETLPYSTIPDWEDVDGMARVFRREVTDD